MREPDVPGADPEPHEELEVVVVAAPVSEQPLAAPVPPGYVPPRPQLRSLRRLFDPSLRDHLTPMLLPYLFFLVTVVTTAAGAVVLVAAFVAAWWWGLIALAVVPVLVLVVIVMVRIVCEVLLAFSQMVERTGDMAAGLSRVENTVDGVASDMPQLGFLRLRAQRRPVDRRS
ncbi:DUF4282 domain-containing protein [Pseudonocardia sp. GCM10023141]|uniref:DUF4282 domain-containing protein n=1 Tax=Pseudonocardia sp. GCM10023141 TaxID=3252653 RepID=UPI00360A4895